VHTSYEEDTHKHKHPKWSGGKCPKYLLDCDKLSAAKLRQKYKAEANSHRAMMDRRKDGALVAKELVDFRSYLRLLGPRPKKGYTMDRIDSSDPEYAVGKIKWRSKTDQSRNRRNVIHLTDVSGATHTLAEWAQLTHQSRYTLHARRKRGLSDQAVIYGPKRSSVHTGHQGFPWPKGHEDQWEAGYRHTSKYLCTVERRELRVEFLHRVVAEKYRNLLDEMERKVNPDPEFVPGPEHDELFRRIEAASRELKRSALLLRQPEYRKRSMEWSQ
jgi:hypothetical protein